MQGFHMYTCVFAVEFCVLGFCCGVGLIDDS